MNVDIPSKFNAAVKRTQIIKQNQEKFNYTKAIEEIKGTTRVKSELLNREILTSKVNADSNATAVLTTAQANSLFNALAIEKDMCRNIKSNLNGKANDFLMNFIWVRLLEKKVTDGVDTFITMDLPSFKP
jgi:hypothetical protein